MRFFLLRGEVFPVSRPEPKNVQLAVKKNPLAWGTDIGWASSARSCPRLPLPRRARGRLRGILQPGYQCVCHGCLRVLRVQVDLLEAG